MATMAAPRLGEKGGTVALADDVWSEGWNEHLVWHVVRNELLHRRQGTHSTKTRSMVRGGGAKPWRQKGTGRSRQGTRRAPQWAGGGVTFGPSPRKHGGKVNRKESAKALRVAFAMHQQRGSLGIVADAIFGETPSTKTARQLLAGWNFKGRARKLTVVCTLDQESVWKSFRNLGNVQVVAVTDIDVADVMWGRGLLVTEQALAVIEGRDTREGGN